MGSSCCSKVEKGTASQPTSSFSFGHMFAVEKKGKIDDFYEVSTTVLEEGSTGIVYKATHKESQVDRAIKSLPSSGSGSLPSEVLLLRSMDHPNIIKLYETFNDAKRTYLVMEMCSGGDLLEAVLKSSGDGHFTENQAATFLEQVLASVTYMHSNDIAHRDIRSENFLLLDTSGQVALKLVDFGMATRCEGRTLKTKCGSAHYMAPEVAYGSYSNKCDVWSTGVLLYIMLFGSPPFDGDDDAQILRAVEEGSVRIPDGQEAPISLCAKEFLGLMLTKDPYVRSCAEPLIRHQFIRRGDVAGRQPLPSVVKNLRRFNTARQLKKVCLTVIAKQLSRNDVEDLRLYFKMLDKNSDGTISKKELVAGLEQVANSIPGVSKEDLAKLMSTVDSDGSGEIDYTEFIAAALDKKTYQKQDVLWSAFRTFDADGNGKIENSELKALMESVGTHVSDAKIKEMLNDADKNKDGFLDFDEFTQLILEE